MPQLSEPNATKTEADLLSVMRTLLPQQQTEVLKMITQRKKTAADAARLFNVHPATIGRLLARASGDAAASKR